MQVFRSFTSSNTLPRSSSIKFTFVISVYWQTLQDPGVLFQALSVQVHHGLALHCLENSRVGRPRAKDITTDFLGRDSSKKATGCMLCTRLGSTGLILARLSLPLGGTASLSDFYGWNERILGRVVVLRPTVQGPSTLNGQRDRQREKERKRANTFRLSR